MDNVIVKSRYPRNSLSSRKRRRSTRDTGLYKDKLAKQIVISIIILMLIGIVKNSNTTVTNFINEKVKGVLSQNIEPQKLYTEIESIVDKVLKKKTDVSTEDADFKEEAVQTNANAYSENGINEDEETGDDTEADTAKKASLPAANSTSQPSSSKASSDTQKAGAASNQTKSMFIVPVEGPLGTPFGTRISPSTGKEQFHNGIDIEAEHGAEIKAAAAGEVIESGYDKSLGNYMKISHENGMSTVYGHCSELLAKKGKKVSQGTVIAKVGNTGLSTGTHLHFEIWKDGKAMNPIDFIKVKDK